MSRTKDQSISRTGGFRFGETDEQFQARVHEIQKLEKQWLAPGRSMHEREQIQRKLCSLKGIDFDSDDE